MHSLLYGPPRLGLNTVHNFWENKKVVSLSTPADCHFKWVSTDGDTAIFSIWTFFSFPFFSITLYIIRYLGRLRGVWRGGQYVYI